MRSLEKEAKIILGFFFSSLPTVPFCFFKTASLEAIASSENSGHLSPITYRSD